MVHSDFLSMPEIRLYGSTQIRADLMKIQPILHGQHLSIHCHSAGKDRVDAKNLQGHPKNVLSWVAVRRLYLLTTAT